MRPTSQSRKASAVEALTNLVVGAALNLALQIVVFPLLGFNATIGENLLIIAIFTVTSVARSYVLRRCFERLRSRGMQ